LDLNDGMLAVARKITASPNIEWRGGSALDLPFADNMFDVVVCQQGLQFFPDRPLALREMWRVLRHGSRLAVACWRDSSHNPAYAAIEHALAVHVGAEHSKLPPFGLGDAGELRGLLDGAGFREIEVRAESKTVHWASIDLFVRASVAAAPTMLGSLAEQGDAVLGDIVARVETEVQPFREADGSIQVPVGNHIVTARS
jgi:SAM-dependent methyltransferase